MTKDPGALDVVRSLVTGLDRTLLLRTGSSRVPLVASIADIRAEVAGEGAGCPLSDVSDWAPRPPTSGPSKSHPAWGPATTAAPDSEADAGAEVDPSAVFAGSVEDVDGDADAGAIMDTMDAISTGELDGVEAGGAARLSPRKSPRRTAATSAGGASTLTGFSSTSARAALAVAADRRRKNDAANDS